MNIQSNIARFEAAMATVQRPGMDKLMEYIQKSDFYTAPASTKYHLSCEGGLLQHSLNVLDALQNILYFVADNKYLYNVAGRSHCVIPSDSVTITALLHDICKTYFYGVSYRNAKNETTGQWEKVPFYTVEDKMPLGHGPKSAMIIKQYIPLTSPELYAIWWHMGFTDAADTLALSGAIDKYPLVWALHSADMMASHFMEDKTDNKREFRDPEPETLGIDGDESGGEWADAPAIGGEALADAAN